MKPDLLNGSGFRAVLRFSLPMILGAFIQQIYTVTDSLVVGNVVGSDALAAIGATGTCIFFLLSLNSGLANACSVVLAQAYGAGSKRDIAASLASTLYYTGLCALVLGVGGGFCVEPLLRLMQTPEDILPQAVLYLRIYICCSAGQIVYNNAAAVLQALGDSKTPLLFLIVCTVLNIALDFLFVLVLRAGVAGAAVATVLSQTISGVLCLVYAVQRYPFLRLRASDLRPDMRNIGRISRIGIPMGLQSSILAIGDMIVAAIINTFGTDTVAAYSAADRIHQFIILPFLYFATAFCTFAAQNIGAGQVERLKKTMRQSACFAAGVALAFGLLIRTLRTPLLMAFLSADDPRLAQVLQIGGDFLSIVPLMYPFLALIWLYNYMLRGVEEVRIPLISGGIELVSKIALPLLLGHRFGYIGVWYAFSICWVLGWIPAVLFYRSGKWVTRYGSKRRTA